MRYAQITFTVYVPLAANETPVAKLSAKDVKTLLVLGFIRYVNDQASRSANVWGDDSVYTVAVDELDDSVASGKTAHLLEAAAAAIAEPEARS